MNRSIPSSDASMEVARREGEILARLQQDLKNKRLVIIVGAGVTLCATADASGKPLSRITWTGLIQNGLDLLVSDGYVERANRRTKRAYEALDDPDVDGLLDAANILSSQLKQHGQFSTWLQSVFGSLHQDVRHPDILEALKKLHQNGAVLLTTNYDDVLETYCGLRRIGRSKIEDIVKFRRGDLEGVFHVHGSYHDPPEMVLDTTDYYQITASDEVQSMLKAFLDDKTIMFVGCGSGLEDPNFDGLLKWAAERQKNIPNKHCLLVRNEDGLACKPLLRVKYGSNYQDLAPYLNKLLDDRQAGNPQLLAQNASEVVDTQLGEKRRANADRICLPCHYISFPTNKRFVGRERKLDALKEALFVQKMCQKIALVGLGGVGKTQVALQLAYWAKENMPEYSIFWVPALSNGSFEQAYTEMAKELPIHLSAENEDLKKSVRQYLSSKRAGPWFLIMDNADDMNLCFGSPDKPGGIVKYLPESEDGLILFTTRSREVAVATAGNDVVELHEMDSEEAMLFLEKSLILKDLLRDTAAATKLLEELTFLPLAIMQAAAYLNTNQMSIPEYLGLLRGTEQNLVGLMSRTFYDNTRYIGSQNAVATTWLISFDQIRKSDSIAADLLSFMSRIEPKAIPRSILPSSQSEEQMVHAIGTLCAYAFLVRRGESKIFDMHSLVHLATRIWVEKNGLVIQSTKNATKHLAVVFPSDDYANRDLWREYLPHTLRALQWSEELDVKEKYHLYLGVGLCLEVDGRIKEAVGYFEKCYEWRKAQFVEGHPDRLTSQHALAGAYQANGQIKKAVELLEHVVAVRVKTLAEDHPSRLASQHALAGTYKANGQIKKTVELLEHVMAVKAKTLAEDHPSRLASQHALAGAYQANGQIEKAVELLEHVIAVEAKTLAKDHPDRLASQHALAEAYQANGQIKKAVELLEHVVTVRVKTLAEDHPSRLASQHALAGTYKANGQIKKAVELLEHVVAIEAKTLAEDHPSRLTSQHALAGAYQANGQIKKAVELLEHVVAIEAKTLAEDHPSRLTSQYALAGAYQANGQIEKAVELLEHVVAVEAKTLAKDHPDRLASQHTLAGAYKANGQVKEAVKLFEHIVAVEAKALAEDHPSRLTSQYALARTYKANGQIKEAVELLEHVVAVETKTLAEDHPDRLTSQHALMYMYTLLAASQDSVR